MRQKIKFSLLLGCVKRRISIDQPEKSEPQTDIDLRISRYLKNEIYIILYITTAVAVIIASGIRQYANLSHAENLSYLNDVLLIAYLAIAVFFFITQVAQTILNDCQIELVNDNLKCLLESVKSVPSFYYLLNDKNSKSLFLLKHKSLDPITKEFILRCLGLRADNVSKIGCQNIEEFLVNNDFNLVDFCGKQICDLDKAVSLVNQSIDEIWKCFFKNNHFIPPLFCFFNRANIAFLIRHFTKLKCKKDVAALTDIFLDEKYIIDLLIELYQTENKAIYIVNYILRCEKMFVDVNNQRTN